jgi:hypothetical protein
VTEGALMNLELRRAVADAVRLVNSHSGRACVSLRFSEDPAEINFVANAARMQGEAFEFQAGFETYGGKLDELSGIRTELIEP